MFSIVLWSLGAVSVQASSLAAVSVGADLRTGITGNKSFLEIDLESGFLDVVKLGSITNVNNLAITEDSLSPSPLRKVEMHGDVTTIEGQSYEPNVELRNAVLLNAAGNVSIDGTLTAKDGPSSQHGTLVLRLLEERFPLLTLVTGPLLVTITMSQFSQQMTLIWVAESVHSMVQPSMDCNS